MKKACILLLALALTLTLVFTFVACNEDEASIKVKFCDSKSVDTALFPGSYDLSEIVSSGLDEFVPSKAGYKFIGWTLDPSGSNKFDPKSYSGSEALLKVYAQWEELRKIETYSGANKLKTYYFDDLKNGDATLDDATKTGYVFKGWTEDADGTKPFNVSSFDYPADVKAVKIFAQFELITTVSFYDGEAVSYTFDLAGLKNGTVSMPTPTKAGYTFDGWYLDKEFKSLFVPQTYVADNAKLSVYAKWASKPQVIYYDGNVVYKQFYLEDADTTVVANPTKEGYTFIKWIDNVGEDFVLNKTATTNQMAYAKWDEKVVVKFYNGADVFTTRYFEDLTDDTLPLIAKDTYTFKGWYKDSTFDTPFVVEGFTPATKEVKAYAKFEKITTIVFMNGEVEVGSRLLSALKDNSVAQPIPSMTGYNFDKWTLDEAGNNLFNIATFTTDEASVEVYAQWTAKLKVTYYVGDTVYEVKYLDEIESASYVPANPVREGYDFVAWINGDSEIFVLDLEATTNQSAYANFDKKVVVNFYDGDTLYASKYFVGLTDADFPTIVKETYTFKGWFCESTFNTPFTLVDLVPVSKEIDAYAKFEKITTVNFMNGASEVGSRLLSGLKDGTLTAPAVEKAGFHFDKWTTDQEGNTPFVAASYETVEATITVYAQWTAKLKVTYYADSTVFDEQFLEDITNSYVPAGTPVKEGYDFVKWVDSSDADFVLDVAALTNVEAFAKWEQKVTVKFYSGEDLVDTKYFDSLTDSNLPTTSKETYTFKGWYTDSTCETPFVVASYVPATKEFKVYAKWEKITTIYFMNGTDEVGSRLLSALKAGTVTLPTTSKVGFNFKEWTLDQAGNNTFNYAVYTTDNGEVTVYAQWTAKLKVTYYADSTVFDTQYLDAIDNSYVPAGTPVKSGFFFDSWVTNDETAAFVLDVTSQTDLIARAKWNKDPVVEDLSATWNDSTKVGTVSWDAYAGATYYTKVDNGEFAECATNAYIIPALTVGKHTISVKIAYKGHESPVASVETVQKIDFNLTGVTFDKDTRIISWTAQTGATYYNVKFNNASSWTKVLTNALPIDIDVAAGDYNIEVIAYQEIDDYIVGSFSSKTTQVTVVSVERTTASGLIINEQDQYVLFAGASYSFSDSTFGASSYYDLSLDAKTITIKEDIAGTVFTLTSLTTSKSIEVKVENYVATLTSGSNWNYYLAAANINNINNPDTNTTGFMDVTQMYEVGTGDNDFVVDVDIDGTGVVDSDYKLDCTGNVGGDSKVSDYLDMAFESDNKYHISWKQAAKALDDGTIVELTVKPHYTSKAQREGTVPSYTFRFKINSGVNAYGYADFKLKFENNENNTVNMHSVITVTQANVDADQPNFGKSESYNRHGYSIFNRTNAKDSDFRLNGNYFKIDASTVAKSTGFDVHPAAPGYSVYWIQSGIMYISTQGGTEEVYDSVSDKTYTVQYSSNATLENLELKGNATFTLTPGDSEFIAAQLLEQSGCMGGVITSGISENILNCSIHHFCESIKIDNPNIKGEKNIYRKNNTHYITKSTFGDNWANNSYLWMDGKVVYKDSHIYKASGPAIVLGDCVSWSLPEPNQLVYENAAEGIYLSNFPLIIFDNTEVDNWAYGSEEYYTAYGISSFVADSKTTLEDNMNSYTNGQYTLLRTNGTYSKVNMVMQVNAERKGDGRGLRSYDIAIVKSNGQLMKQEIRIAETSGGDVYYPNHPLSSKAPYMMMYPISDYSTAAAFGQMYFSVTNADPANGPLGEIAIYGGYLQALQANPLNPAIQFTDIMASIPLLIEAFGAQNLATASASMTIDVAGTPTVMPISTLIQNSDGQAAIAARVFYTHGMKAADDATDGPLYVEVSLSTSNGITLGSNVVTTILVEAERVA